MIVDKWDHRISDVITGLYTFNAEGTYNLTTTPEKIQEYMWLLFNDPQTAIMVNYLDDVFRGFAIVSYDSEFQIENFGYVNKFYVMPVGRKTYAGRELVQEMVDFFDEKDCIASFATATAGIGRDKQFINLFCKFGFKQHPTALIRKYNEQN